MIIRMRYTLLTLLSLVIFLSSMATAHAQLRNTDMVLTISPPYPAPLQNVEAKISTAVTDLEKAYISWSLNGQRMASGVGKKIFSFEIGADAVDVELVVSVETVDGQSVVKSIRIKPAEIDILWEAVDSYAPPFYRGKTLVAKEGTFKVAAMPSVVSLSGKISSNNLSYAWQKDNKAQQSASGWGKRSFIFNNSYLDRANQINVKVSDIEGNINTAGKIVIAPFNPKIVFYRMDKSLGMITETALQDGFEVKEGGETIAGIPYFINPDNLNSGDIEYSWKVGGEDIYTVNPRYQVSLVPESGKSGSSTLRLYVENTRNLFEGVSKTINVRF